MTRLLKHNALPAVRLAVLVTASLFACARVTYATPAGGVTTGGQATIHQNGLNTTITQTTDRAVIRWDQFDVAKTESVNFQQPSATSITVNRIRDTKPSQIDGSITANGQVVLINPNGVMFGRDATVDVNGIIATSSDIGDDAAFMAGGALKFTTPGNANARIVNEGRITVGQAGLVGLVAPHVENHGVISARLGKAVLASGDIATIDMAGDDLIKLEASDALVAQSVQNTGTIAADGGMVLITAAQARGAVDALIMSSGTVRADSVGATTGSIRIAANGIQATAVRKHSQVIISGTLQARGNAAGEKGGRIGVSGDSITLANTAVVDAAGHSGGGRVRIGGEYQGGAGMPTASRTQINHGAVIRVNATQNGNGGSAVVWSDDVTQFAGHADASGGVAGGVGGLVEVSGKHYLDFRGTVNLRGLHGNGSLLLDPTNITISAAANSNVNGATPFSPTIDDSTSVLNSATLLAALASGNVVVQTRATGSQAGDITVSAPLSWTSGNGLTLQAHNLITINSAINAGANGSLTLDAADVVIGAALAGTGTLTFTPNSDLLTLGIGAGAVGAYNVSAAELALLTNGWGNIVFGRTTSSAATDIRASTWNDHLTLQSGSGGITTTGTLNMNTNNLTLRTDANPVIGGALTGTGALTIVQSSATTSMGLGTGQLGTLHLDDAELANITNGWTSLTFGRSDGSGDVNVGALAWNDPLTLQSGAGALNINGAQTMAANALTLRTDADLLLAGALSGTSTLTIVQSSPTTSIALGNGEVGTLHLDDAELDNITNGFSGIIIGRPDASGTMHVGTNTWDDPLTLRSGTGIISINGNQTMGGNALAIATDADVVLNANLSGTSTFALTPVTASTSMGLGDGQPGTIHLDNAELGRILNGFSGLVFGNVTMTGALNVGARSWTDPLNLRTGSGQLNINGAQNLANNAFAISTDSNLQLGANIAGTSTLTIAPSSVGTSVGLGTGQAGTLHLDDTELGRIVNGFSSIVIGTTSLTGAMNVGAWTWNDPLTLRTGTGQMNINGAMTMNANNLALVTNSNLAINANLIGTGTLTVQGASTPTTIGVGTGQAGTLQIDDNELGRMLDGWALRVFGATNQTGALNIGARTWVDSIDLRTSSGAMNINGTQNMGANNLTIRTNTNLTLNNNLAGSGTLTILTSTASTTMGIGTGQVGTLQLDAADLSRILDGWGLISFGATNRTGAINVGALTWTDALRFVTNTGVININGAQTMGANNLTFMTATNPNIGAALTGTGTLNFQGSAVATTVAVGTGQTGTVLIDDTELARFTDGWGLISFGRTDGTGVINMGARSWNDSVLVQSSTGAINVNGAQNFGANNFTISTNANPTLSAAVAGTGTFTLQGSSAAGTLSIGGGAGTVALSPAELALLSNGWGNLIFGRADGTGAINVAANTWLDNVTLRTGAGLLTISGAQTMGANNLTIEANSNPAINAALTGTGQLTIRGSSTATTVGVGTGQAGTLQLADTELAFFTPGWAGITIGRSDGLGAMNLGAYTWADPMTFIAQGNVVLNGVQTSSRPSGTSLVFVTTGGAFINNAGAAGINPGGGRYLVYSVDSALDTPGGLTPDNIVTNKTYASYLPPAVVEAGNVFIYSGAVAKILYIEIDDAFREYGDLLPLFTYTYLGGLQNGDTLAAIIASYTLDSPTASILDPAGTTRAITGNFTLNNGYTINIINGTLTTTKATVVATADDYSRVYGNANPAFTVSYSGFRNGEDETDLNALATASSTATLTSNVGSYIITVSGGSDSNYNIVYVSGDLTITKAPIVVTAQNTTRQYGAANPVFTFNYTGFKNGENSGVIDTLASGTTPATLISNVGSYAINGAGAADDNYSFTYVAGSLSVTKAPLVATANNQTRTYGAANPAFTVSYSGFLNGDTAGMIDTAAVGSSAAIGTTGVGSYAITASGAVDNNYSFTYVPGTLSITKASLTATASSASRAYGAANPALSVNYTGFVNGETSAVIDTGATASTAAIATTGVGSYATTASGAVDDNYDFVYAPGTLTITKALLTATANNATRTYGAANPAFTVSYSGFVNGENSGVIDALATAVSGATGLSSVGSYAITASGAADDNYDFVYAPGTLTITKALLTATANNATRTYGAANPAFTVNYTGFVNGENSGVIDVAATANSAAIGTTGVGTHAITASGASDGNYDFVYAPGTLTITKALLTATASSGTRTYGAANPGFTVSYTGFVNGENDGVIDTAATATTAAIATTNVGSYATTASGAVDDNYDFVYTPGTLTITKATLTATADDKTRVYGAANPTLTFNYSGFVNGENAGVINTAAVGSTPAVGTSGVGTYAITGSGAVDNNYDFVYAPGTLTITKATLTATANNQTRAYGAANPAFTVSYTGFANGENAGVIDALATAVSGATGLSSVGSYAITASGAADDNYDFVYAPGTLTITKALLTATASSASRVYGAGNPGLTVSYSGFVNGENASVIDTAATASSAATNFSNVGSYATTASGAVDDNYSFAYVNGALTITKATLTATAVNASRTYGAANPAFVVSYSGFVNGDNASAIDVDVAASSLANSFSNVGSYAINSSSGLDNNYDFVYAPGTLTITKATLIASTPNQLRPMSEANPAFVVNYTGFVNGENASVIDTLATASSAATMGSPAGSYAITVSGANDNNYDFVYTGGVLLVYEGAQPVGDTDIPARTEPQQTRSNAAQHFDIVADRPAIRAGSNGDIVIIADADFDVRAGSTFLIGMTQELLQSYGASTYTRLMLTAQYLETAHPRVKRKVLRNRPVNVFRPALTREI